MGQPRFATILVLLLTGTVAAQVQPDGRGKSGSTANKSEVKNTSQQPAQLFWYRDMTLTLREAQRRREPIVVLFFSETAPAHTKQNVELPKRPAQEELVRWTRAYLDVNQFAREARELVVDGTPAFRILTQGGRLVASHDGFLTAPELSAWLRAHRDEALIQPGKELTSQEAPDKDTLADLLGDLKSREPGIREAAVRRLLPYPQEAARAAVDAFGQGSLQARLAILELLRAWGAPAADLDPWQPETITQARLKALSGWADRARPTRAGTPGVPLTAPELASLKLEIGRMLQMDEAAAAAARERLARHGRALLPEVYILLKEAATDQDRERLTALRYRLVASDRLVLNWPGGVERLAATDATIRHQAVTDLVARASADDEPLLLELFSNPDALVRELALRALERIADPRALEALLNLLKDPEPNVRASVLKQLAERPLPGMVPKIVAYVPGEKDPDLVIHAVRFLKASHSPEALDCLKALLKHPSWSVRSEAADALRELLARSTVAEEIKADVCVALLDVLKDPDGFVASRAVDALQAADLAVAVEPLVQAALHNVSLAPHIVAALAAGNRMKVAALPQLRRFCAHGEAAIRAAAITSLSHAAPGDIDDELRATLGDRDGSVRRAAAQALFTVLQAQAPESHGDGREPEGWREAVRHGKRGPAWLKTMPGLLLPLLKAGDAGERLAAALPLVGLDHEDAAWPVLATAGQLDPDARQEPATALPWLSWPRRLQLFHILTAASADPDQLAPVIDQFVKVRDERAAEPLWKVAAGPPAKPEVAQALLRGLETLYLGDPNAIPRHRAIGPAERKTVEAAARPRAEAGSATQRRLALILLVAAAPETAAELSRKMAANAQEDELLRQNALQVLLFSLGKSASQPVAVAHLTSDAVRLRRIAVQFLAMGPVVIRNLYPDNLPLPVDNSAVYSGQRGDDDEAVTRTPPGLKPEMLLPLIKDTNLQAAASAGYLLTLLGRPEGLNPLVDYWRRYGNNNETIVRLLYQAIAAMNDDGKVAILEAIYRAIRNDDAKISQFYWTIRGMDGPNALRLRKTIRQEVGMERLRR